MSVNELHPSRSLSLRRGGAGLTPEGCQLDASLRSTGPRGDLRPLPSTSNFNVPAPLADGRVPFEQQGPALVFGEVVPCNVERFTRATTPARNPLRSVLKVRMLGFQRNAPGPQKQTPVRTTVSGIRTPIVDV